MSGVPNEFSPRSPQPAVSLAQFANILSLSLITCYPHWDVGLVKSGRGQTHRRENVHIDLRLEFQQGDVVVKCGIVKISVKVFLTDLDDFSDKV